LLCPQLNTILSHADILYPQLNAILSHADILLCQSWQYYTMLISCCAHSWTQYYTMLISCCAHSWTQYYPMLIFCCVHNWTQYCTMLISCCAHSWTQYCPMLISCCAHSWTQYRLNVSCTFKVFFDSPSRTNFCVSFALGLQADCTASPQLCDNNIYCFCWIKGNFLYILKLCRLTRRLLFI